jgi:hypothetical protein
MSTRIALPIGLLTLSLSWSVNAHHSGAMFDDKKSVELSGTVLRYQWTNPHCWIQLIVAGADGATEWSIEMGSPSVLFRGGWRPTTLVPGDRVTVTVRPLRDGSNGALYVSATREGGEPIVAPISAADAAPGAVHP